MKIGLVQLTSVLDYQVNLKKIEHFLQEARVQGADLIFLPEVFYSLSDGITPTPYLVEEGNEHYLNLQKLSLKYSLPLIGGSVAYRDGGKIKNRMMNFNEKGEFLGAPYDKVNLFSLDATSGQNTKNIIDESRTFSSGEELRMLSYRDWKIGCSICFDLRFPELFRWYFSQGCNLLTISSAFTRITGMAHWHILNRARAIENQCYVVACGQWGEHNSRVKTYGHSLVVDPWGEVLVDAGEGVKIVYAEISHDRIKEVRQRLSVRPIQIHEGKVSR